MKRLLARLADAPMRAVIVAAIALSCGGDKTTPPDTTPAALHASATMPATATAGGAAPVLPSVVVVTKSGTPVSGASVRFDVAAGGGVLTGATQLTNASGVATVGGWTLGTTPGTNTLTASIATNAAASVSFSITGVAPTPASIAKESGDAQTASAGSAVAIAPSVRVTDATGIPVPGALVTFTIATGQGTIVGAAATTNASGVATAGVWTLGTTAGANTLTASVAGLPAVSFTATSVAGAATTIVIVTQPVGGATGLPLPTQPVVAVEDRYGNTLAADNGRIVGAAIAPGGDGTISGPASASTASGVATFAGLVITGATSASRALVFTTAGLASVTSAAIALSPPPPGPFIATIAPAVLAPGTTATITGTSFGGAISANVVTIDGVTATVVAATPTQLTVRLPATGFACRAQRDVSVAITTGGITGSRQHPLRAAQPRTLAVGQSLLLSAAAELPCNELSAGGEYVVSVVNASTNGAASTGFQLRGGPQGYVAAGAIAPLVTRSTAAPRAELPHGSFFSPSREERDRQIEHMAHLERNRATWTSLTARRRTLESRASQATSTQVYSPIPTTLGARSTLQFQYTGPTEFRTVSTVYVGTHVIIVEDVGSPLAGTLSAYYQQIGADFDSRMYDILRTNFGDPLANDAQLHATGRVVLFFTPRVSQLSPPLAGFVNPCDTFSVAVCTASNEQAVAYLSSPLASWTPAQTDFWKSYMHAVIQHESKHIVSQAERAARNSSQFEESWLEEGSAEIALELYARNLCGFAVGLRISYAQLTTCMNTQPWTPDLLEGIGYTLYKFYLDEESLSPIVGNAIVNGQLQLFNYESAWSLLRWTASTYGASDAAFFTSLVQERSLTGASNLLARAGQPLDLLLGEWSLMLDVDDRPAFAPTNSHLTFPNIRTRDFLAGVRTAYGLTTPAFPLQVRSATTSASFSTDVAGIAAGASSLFELGAPGASGFIVELRDAAGNPLAANTLLRLGLVRLQ